MIKYGWAVLPSWLLVAACSARTSELPKLAEPQELFWATLQGLCGRAFAGTVREAPPSDTTFANQELIMHVRQCRDDEISIPFHVGTNRSRTWIVSRTGAGLRLKHDHRHEDGSEDAITQYGGDTRSVGTDGRQEFSADTHTASLIPAAATNVWTIEVRAADSFTYALRREGTDRRFRIEFDLTRDVSTPPAPWGH